MNNNIKVLPKSKVKELSDYLTNHLKEFYSDSLINQQVKERELLVNALEIIYFYHSFPFYKVFLRNDLDISTNYLKSFVDNKLKNYSHLNDYNPVVENLSLYFKTVSLKKYKESNYSNKLEKINLLLLDSIDNLDVKTFVLNSDFGELLIDLEHFKLIVSAKYTLGYSVIDKRSGHLLETWEYFPSQVTLKAFKQAFIDLANKHKELYPIAMFLFENL